MKAIEMTGDKYWMRFGDPEQSSSHTGNLAGKYLFFSQDKQLLINTAITEIREHDFEVAKISQNPRSGDFVLCLYWHDDSRRYELKDRYRGMQEVIRYRWWKSNADTRAGKYSKQFKSQEEYA